MSEVPGAAKTLLKRLDGWTVRTNPGRGELEFNALGDPRGDGTRPRIAVAEPVESYRIVAWHPDGRAFDAVWVRRDGQTRWSLDSAWRGRGPDEFTPKKLTATELRTYVAWTGAASDSNEEAA